MRFVPKTDAELELDGLLPDDTYEAEVIQCAEKVSKKGQDMLAIKLNVLDGEGRGHHVYDYVSPHFFPQKFKAFFESMGQLPMYESGVIDPELILGQYVTAIIVTEQGGDYPAKNVCKDYLTAEAANLQRRKPAILAEAKAEAEKPGGDLPFAFAPIVPFLVAFLGIAATLHA